VSARIEVYRTRSLLRGERWRWRLLSGNDNVVAVSGEGYANKTHCRDMALLVTDGTYKNAPLVEP
jgi:uncharacterized protein YegP (UPF0339 family)